MRCPTAQNASRKSLAPEAETIESWMQALEENIGDVADNMDSRNIGIEVKEIELERKRVQSTELRLKEFTTRAEVQDLSVKEGKSQLAAKIFLVKRTSGLSDDRRTTSHKCCKPKSK